MDKIKHKILVLSGKGGVGKSTVSVHLAREFVKQGKKVGLLDIDLCGPSLPKILGVDSHKVHQSSEGWIPIFVDKDQRLCVMSIGFLLKDKETAVVWRGPKKTATIKQFLEDVYWGDLDYLIIDTPPGTSDEHISICEYLMHFSPDGAVLVTTPQGVSLSDVRKEISFCKKLSIPILGLIENMSGFICPHCSECTNIFSTGGGTALANHCSIPFLGRIPIDPNLGITMEEGNTISNTNSQSLTIVETFVNEHIKHNEISNSIED